MVLVNKQTTEPSLGHTAEPIWRYEVNIKVLGGRWNELRHVCCMPDYLLHQISGWLSIVSETVKLNSGDLSNPLKVIWEAFLISMYQINFWYLNRFSINKWVNCRPASRNSLTFHQPSALCCGGRKQLFFHPSVHQEQLGVQWRAQRQLNTASGGARDRTSNL